MSSPRGSDSVSTRRQIRNAGRGASAHDRRAHGSHGGPETAAVMPVDVAARAPAPRRRDLREARARRSRLQRVVPVTAVLLAASLVGSASWAGSSAPRTDPAGRAVVVPVAVSALETLEASAARVALESSVVPLLAAEATAPARAAVIQISRAGEREVPAAAGDGANGLRAAAAPERARVAMPLEVGTYRVTSRYGYRVSPLGGGSQFHTGVDMAAALGTPIHAVADGVVAYVGPGKEGRSSMLVIVEHTIDEKVYYTWYNHMFASGLYVTAGQQVSAGEVIAGVGNNGNSTGPHLHLEVHTDDRLTTTEPLSWLQQHSAVDPSGLD